MTEEEVEVVAAELAKAGGVSWHAGQERGPLKLVMDRYRDRARVAIAALERVRAARQEVPSGRFTGEQRWLTARVNPESSSREPISIGSLVLYRPPGDDRTYSCRIEKVDGNYVFLVPEIPTCTGWVDLENISPSSVQ